jgi:hypothetical protein
MYRERWKRRSEKLRVVQSPRQTDAHSVPAVRADGSQGIEVRPGRRGGGLNDGMFQRDYHDLCPLQGLRQPAAHLTKDALAKR